MPRPKKTCRVAFVPNSAYFKPSGVPLRLLEEVSISIEEAESLRLRDIENLEQEQCARYMNISRATYQRILESARKKVALALLGGKAIRIEGGDFELEEPPCCCKLGCRDDMSEETSARWSAESCSICHRFRHSGEVTSATNEGLANEGSNSLYQSNEFNKRRQNEMKIALVTDDEKTISQHFGRATLYLVYTVEDGKITGKETRPKIGHRHFAFKDERPHVHGERHGFDLASVSRHASMAEAIKDSQVLIAGGMGMGAFRSMESCHIEPVVTDVENIEEAVKLYIEGKLPNLINRVH
jgi:predicted DNA-binding protein (UPF0251 family)/predicted Fe-Mo cluster-binding NifX family protein